MYKYKLNIITNITPEIIERIMRIIRHRGFFIQKININVMKKFKNINFYLVVKSSRHINFLVKQIVKLIDVLDVVIIS